MKSIGVLGGLGPQATIDFESRVHAVSLKLIPSRRSGGYPPMVVYYYRHPPFLVNEDDSLVLPIRPDPRLIDAAQKLNGLADFLVITANAPHLVRDQLAEAFCGPVLSIVDVTLKEIFQRGLTRLGVLGLGDPRIYLGPLQARGVVTVTLDKGLQPKLDTAIFAVMEGRAGAAERITAHHAIDMLLNLGVEGVLLGCTELPLLLGPNDLAAHLINPSQMLAEAAVRFAISDVAVLKSGISTEPKAPSKDSLQVLA